jgi:hypothetical protein
MRLAGVTPVAPVNPHTGLPERLKHQFYLVEYLPLTLEAALAHDFHGVRPSFQWVIAVLSDVRGRCLFPAGHVYLWAPWLRMRVICVRG